MTNIEKAYNKLVTAKQEYIEELEKSLKHKNGQIEYLESILKLHDLED